MKTCKRAMVSLAIISAAIAAFCVPASTHKAAVASYDPISYWLVLDRLFDSDSEEFGPYKTIDQWDVLNILFKPHADGRLGFYEMDYISQWVTLNKLFVTGRGQIQ